MLLGAAAVTLLAGSAGAADLAVKAMPQQAAPFIASPWDGLYIGGNVGFGSTDFSAAASIFGLSGTDSVTGSGVVGGVQAGYNKTFGSFLLGLETDFDATSISNTTGGVETKLPWFGTTRIRAGFLLTPALLFYGTGGVAYGHAEISAPDASITVPGVGWAAGAGLEWKFAPQWSIGAEYLHVELDGPNANIGPVTFTTKATTDLGRGTVNFHF
jgi:outer membrane immunogenic protein